MQEGEIDVGTSALEGGDPRLTGRQLLATGLRIWALWWLVHGVAYAIQTGPLRSEDVLGPDEWLVRIWDRELVRALVHVLASVVLLTAASPLSRALLPEPTSPSLAPVVGAGAVCVGVALFVTGAASLLSVAIHPTPWPQPAFPEAIDVVATTNESDQPLLGGAALQVACGLLALAAPRVIWVVRRRETKPA